MSGGPIIPEEQISNLLSSLEDFYEDRMAELNWKYLPYTRVDYTEETKKDAEEDDYVDCM